MRWPYVSLTTPPWPSIRHRLDDLFTHPSSQRAFVADLAAGDISPPETSLCTARGEYAGSTRCSVPANTSVASPSCVQLLSGLDHTRTAVCRHTIVEAPPAISDVLLGLKPHVWQYLESQSRTAKLSGTRMMLEEDNFQSKYTCTLKIADDCVTPARRIIGRCSVLLGNFNTVPNG